MPVTMFWSYHVQDWARWSATLKEMNEQDPLARERRQKYGLIRRSVFRSVDASQDPEGMRRWYERTGLEVFPPVLITEEFGDVRYTASVTDS